MLRSVETRRTLLRAAGISAVIDPAGRIQQALELQDPDVVGFVGAQGILSQVPLIDPGHRTVFVRWGGAIWWLYLLALPVIGAGLAARPRRTT